MLHRSYVTPCGFVPYRGLSSYPTEDIIYGGRIQRSYIVGYGGRPPSYPDVFLHHRHVSIDYGSLGFGQFYFCMERDGGKVR